MSAANKPTLESIVTRFRREAEKGAPPGGSAELEVRLQDVNYPSFAAIYQALLTNTSSESQPPKLKLGEQRLVQMISAIMNIRQARGEGAQRHLQPMRIREIYFEGGKKARERIVRKEPLVPALRVPSTTALAYMVALAEEREEAEGFSADEGAIIRVKARVSFHLTLAGTSELKPELQWRVDMTVVREIMGSDAETALGRIVDQMFRTNPAMTPANFLAVLRLADDESPAARALYKYEVEAELVGSSTGLDAVRPSDVTAAAETILRLANPDYVLEASMQTEVYRAAQYIVKAPGYLRQFQHDLGLKRLLPQANAITRADYRAIYPPKDMYLTEKADGKRALALVHDGRGAVIADTLHDFAAPSAKKGPGPSDPKSRLANDTVVDGEFVQREGPGGPVFEFYAFDLIAIAGENVTSDPFEKRLARLAEAVSILSEAGIPAFAKQYVRIADSTPAYLEEVIQGVYSAKRKYSVDGLIFVEPGKPYEETANYKWKSARDNTIDFLARRAPASVLGRPPFVDRPGHKVYFLFVGISPELYESLGLQWCPGYSDLFGSRVETGRPPRGAARAPADRMDANTGSYFPIQFSPSDVPMAYVYQHPNDSPLGDIDAKVVEGRCAGSCPSAGGGVPLVEWEMLRVREDRRRDLLTKRYYGNDYYTAELIWLNYVDPFPVEQLWEGPSLDYFMRPKSGIYRAQTALISYMKTERILSLKHANWVVDIATGKGQDLGRYLEAEVHNLVAIDQDRAALSQLVRRKYSFAGRGRPPVEGDESGSGESRGRRGAAARGATARGATAIKILVADAGSPYAATLTKLEHLGLQRMTADAVVCNLAIHYFLGSLDSLRNFVALVRGIVKVGGTVVITALIGEAVHKLFLKEKVPEGSSWEIREGDGAAPKYALKRLYSSTALEAVGQQIGVLLPFSDGRFYEEYLVNTKLVTKEFTDRGFRLKATTNAAALIPDFEARNRTVAELLTEGDKKYLSLYGELIFSRDK
jgi:hypothetical protein